MALPEHLELLGGHSIDSTGLWRHRSRREGKPTNLVFPFEIETMHIGPEHIDVDAVRTAP